MKINDKEKRLLDKFMDWYKGEVKYNYEKLVGFIIGTLDNLEECNFNNIIGWFVINEINCRDISEFIEDEDEEYIDKEMWCSLKKKVDEVYLWSKYYDIMQEIRDDFVSEYSN